MALEGPDVFNEEECMNQVFRDLVSSRAVQTVGAARALGSVAHNGLKGALREVVVRDLIQPLLPPGFLVGSGQIISAWGQLSGQIDIVVADGRVLPPILFERAQGFFPIEAVVATIEVKSVLTSTELQLAHASALKVSSFIHASPLGQQGHLPEQKVEHVISFLLAFSTDLAPGGKSELQRYGEKYCASEPSIRALCVVGRGFWVRNDEKWIDYQCTCDEGELVGLITAVANICQRVSKSRLQPDIRDYIENDFPPWHTS